jgi:hypothetical protein
MAPRKPLIVSSISSRYVEKSPSRSVEDSLSAQYLFDFDQDQNVARRGGSEIEQERQIVVMADLKADTRRRLILATKQKLRKGQLSAANMMVGAVRSAPLGQFDVIERIRISRAGGVSSRLTTPAR